MFSTPLSLDVVLALMIADVMAAILFAWAQRDWLYFPTVLTALFTALLVAVCAVVQPAGVWFYLLAAYAVGLAGLLGVGWTRRLQAEARRHDPRPR